VEEQESKGLSWSGDGVWKNVGGGGAEEDSLIEDA
jgi:hypothetical protein